MSSNLKVNNILPSTGANIGLGTASGTLNVDGGCKVQVGTALTLGHTQGVQFHTQNLHSTGFEVNQINASGIVTSSTQINVGSNIKLGSAGVVTATSFVGSGANLTNLPTATSITVADESSDTTCYPLYVTATTGNLAPKTGTNLEFNSASGNLRAASVFCGTSSNESKTQDGLILERNSGDGEAHITAGRTGGNYSGMQFYVAGGSGVTKRYQIDYQSNFRWYGADGTTERMRLFSTGQLGINRDTTPLNGVKLMVQNNSNNVFYAYHEGTGNNYSILCRNDRATGSTQATQIIFLASGNVFVGDIRSNGSSTAYNTSSDYRLKENVTTISDGITRLKTLKPYRFNFISNPSQTVDGFLAHEVTAVPEAISGTKDEVVTQAMIDNGDAPSDSKLNDPIYQQIDQSKIVPLLTAALQEAITKIETLEAKVAALEGS